MPARPLRCNYSVSLANTYNDMCVGAGPGLQSSHDPVGHSQDEGVPGRSGDDHGSHVPDRQGIPELSGSTAHVAPDDGWEA